MDTPPSPPPLRRLRPPPPPGHHRSVISSQLKAVQNLLTNIEESNSQVNRRTRRYYSRRCKNRSPANIESLPDDLVFRILLRLSAQDIYDAARFVCRKWYKIIRTDNFINEHLQHSTSGLLVQSVDDLHHPFFLSMPHSQVEISKFSYEFGSMLWRSCNGLIIQHDLCNEEFVLYIVNPATKQLFALPHLPRGSKFQGCMGFAATSKEYKVVCTFKCDDARRCLILTVGVDKSWRPVCTQYLSSAALRLFVSVPIVTDGFMHWPAVYGSHFLTLNIETEIIIQIGVPQSCGGKLKFFLPSSERCLSLLADNGNCSWEVWEMKIEIGEWTKLLNVNLEAHKCTFQKFMYGSHALFPLPRGWLKHKELLIFSFLFPTQVLFTYNVCTQELEVLEFDLCSRFYFHAHRSSLVWSG